MRLPVLPASILATEVAILSNFLLNDRWTFRAVGRHSFGQRLLRFNGVALGGMAISIATLAILTTYTQLDLPLANVFAVGAAMAWNYVVNSRWTWRSRQEAVGRRQSAVNDTTLPTAYRRLPTAVEEVTA
jgi:putative flippase GtrA